MNTKLPVRKDDRRASEGRSVERQWAADAAIRHAEKVAILARLKRATKEG